MSQRKEKYARKVVQRMDKLETAVDQIKDDAISQRFRVNVIEADLAVYHAAKAERAKKEMKEAERKAAMYHRKRAEQYKGNLLLLRCLLASMLLFLFLMAVFACIA